MQEIGKTTVRALTTRISFIREEVNDNKADNDFYVIDFSTYTTDISYNFCVHNVFLKKIVTPYSKRVIVSHMSGTVLCTVF